MILKGVPSSPGKAEGSIKILEDEAVAPPVVAEPFTLSTISWDEAVEAVKAELLKDMQKALDLAGPEASAIFQAQMMIAEDPMLKELAGEIAGGEPGPDDVLKAAESIAGRFDSMEDEYIKARAADIRQVGALLAGALGGGGREHAETGEVDSMQGSHILAAKDITPSQTVRLDTDSILGILLEGGTVNSHASILARAMGIPCIVGIKALLANCKDGDFCHMDATSGEVALGEAHLNDHNPQGQNDPQRVKFARKLATKDGHQVGLALNIGNPSELEKAAKVGLAGLDIGLMRTEFIFLGAEKMPDVEAQRGVYAGIAELAKGGRVRFRTLDIGGDKKPSFIEIPKEENPYLGVRSIRHSLRNELLFKAQLEALVKTAFDFPLDIMFPMVTVPEELWAARRKLDEVIGSQRSESTIRRNLRVGIMMETPATCLMADIFARECDFMSIGTNDLVQYTMAADRGNPDVGALYQQASPAVLRLIRMCAEAGRVSGCEVSVCGELAGSIEGAVLLTGLGVDKLSMAPSRTGVIADIMEKVTFETVKDAAERALKMTTQEEVISSVADILSGKGNLMEV